MQDVHIHIAKLIIRGKDDDCYRINVVSIFRKGNLDMFNVCKTELRGIGSFD